MYFDFTLRIGEFPVIGHPSVSELKPRHFIDLQKGIEEKGLLEVASRTRRHLSNIMRHAVHQGFIDSNPAANLDGVTAPLTRHHYHALPLERLSELIEHIEAYHQGRALPRLAVLLTLHLLAALCELVRDWMGTTRERISEATAFVRWPAVPDGVWFMVAGYSGTPDGSPEARHRASGLHS